MECFNCGNCKEDSTLYYCPKSNDFIIKDSNQAKEKNRSGWKKGRPEYESRRRKNKKREIV